MGKEIERKFLIQSLDYRQEATKTYYKQGYISTDKNGVVRVRIIGDRGYLTIKGANQKAVRDEYEYLIPLNDAQEMIETLCQKPIIEKYRYKKEVSGLWWEIDEFLGDNEGLTIAEVELPCEDYAVILPEWIGKEVTGNPLYYNSNLVKHPYKDWNKK